MLKDMEGTMTFSALNHPVKYNSYELGRQVKGSDNYHWR